MKILHKYIARSVIASTALVLLVMVGLIFVIDFLEELKDVGSGDYGFAQAFVHVLLESPRHLYQFFPMLVLIGGVIGLGVLSAHQELVVMRAAGFSVRRIALAVIAAALSLTLVATAVGELLVPKSHHLATTRKQSEQSGGQAVATLSGIWIHEGNNFLQINRVEGLQHLVGVTRYQFDAQHHLLATYYVASLERRQGKWLSHDVLKTTFANNQTQSQHLGEMVWDMPLNPNLLNVGLIEPPEMSLATLHNYSQHLVQNGLQASDFEWEFWKRIFQPLTTIVMILLAVPFVLVFSRSVTMGWRVFFGIVVGFVFYILNAFLGQFSIVFQFSPLLAALLPTLLFALLGYVFARKVNRH
ncbi:MAG: LPS export ABC transporter permease LptG [Pseudomonadota bacterium]